MYGLLLRFTTVRTRHRLPYFDTKFNRKAKFRAALQIPVSISTLPGIGTAMLYTLFFTISQQNIVANAHAQTYTL